jgi:hypothetical protein
VSNEFLNLPEYDKLRSNQMSLLKALYGAFKSSLDDKKIARMFITGVCIFIFIFILFIFLVAIALYLLSFCS